MLDPRTSDGSRSGVNWIRRNEQSILAAMARASSVLPTPGTSSISTWPSASRATTASRITSGLPRTTSPTFSISRFERERSSSRSGIAGSVIWDGIHAVRSGDGTVRLALPWSLRGKFTSINDRRTDSNGWMDGRGKSTSAGGRSRPKLGRAALAPAWLRIHGRRRDQDLDPRWPARLMTMAAGRWPRCSIGWNGAAAGSGSLSFQSGPDLFADPRAIEVPALGKPLAPPTGLRGLRSHGRLEPPELIHVIHDEMADVGPRLVGHLRLYRTCRPCRGSGPSTGACA